jgi:hypothetical protein
MGYSCELSCVVGDQRQSKASGVSGNKEVISGDHSALCFQTGPDLCIIGRLIRKIEGLDVGEESSECSLVPLLVGRNFDSYKSSVFVTAEMRTSLTGVFLSRLRSASLDRFMT